MSLEEFKLRYFSKYPTSKLEILEEFTNDYSVLVKDRYGICKIRKDHLYNGVVPTIQSAINKNEYYINKAKYKRGELYDYSLVNYTIASNKIKIICRKHGIFEQNAATHLTGQGCCKCGDERCSIHHGSNPTGWTLTNWEKASHRSKNFTSFKLYIIECWNDDEKFYKIGRTFLKLNCRFRSDKFMPYNYNIIKIIQGSAKEIYKLESKMKRENKENKYIPKIKFGGMYECFSNLINIENYENYY